MRRKVIQDLANTLCQMQASWRADEDLEILAELPDGELSIDALAGIATHERVGPVQLQIAGELRTWLSQRLVVSQIPPQAISSAVVTTQIRTDRLPTHRERIVSFDFSVRSLVTTHECSYEGKLWEVHRWHTRTAASSRNASSEMPNE